MDEYDVKTYYTLAWSTTLTQDVYIRGKAIGKNTKLPKDPKMLYGTNENDIFKIKRVEYETEITYDVFTQKQSVRYIPIVEEFSIQRDMRIIVWEGSEELSLLNDDYRIVTPEDFEDLVRLSDVECEVASTPEPAKVTHKERIWKRYNNPKNNISDRMLGALSYA